MSHTSLRLAAAAAAFAAVAAGTSTAHAFCGFYVGGAGAELYNNATQVVLMRHGTTTVLSMQNNYQGPPEGFALIIPVPVVVKEGQVKTLPHDVFAKIDTLGAPRLVEYWEQDPCYVEPPYEREEMYAMDVESTSADDEGSDSDAEPYHVKIEAQFSVAEYDIVVLSATESTGLDRWLRDNHYQIPAGAEPLLRPYVESGVKFFVAKVDPKKVRFDKGMATLSPLRVHYDSPDFTLPIRLGLANSNGAQDLIVNILAPSSRYEVANRPSAVIPTNLLVTDAVRTRFGEFYAALFDHVLAKVPNAVVTEYAWDSGSCDPCPGPTLDQNDLATLGGDVLAATYKDASFWNMTLTRLHARYGTEVSDDLVFRAVEPLEGGRGIPDAEGKIEGGSRLTSTNNFQGRYIILHPWTGAVACEAPVRGRWGGPPAGTTNQIAAPTANDLAFAPRGGVELGTLVASDVPEIGVLASGDNKLPLPTRKPQGCTCATTGAGSAAGALALSAAVGLVLARRRRRAA
jgi:MYXO-CTERM domain-containing protein